MVMPHRVAQRTQVVLQGFDVRRHPHRLVGGVEPANETRLLGGDTGGAVAGVALLGLDTADGKHRLAGDAEHVGTECQGECGIGWESELSRGAEHDGILKAVLGKGAVHRRECLSDRKGDMIGEHERGSTRAALTAVVQDGDLAPAGRRHVLGEFGPERTVTDSRLDADGFPGSIGDALDELDEAGDVIECPVSGRAAHRDADLDAAGVVVNRMLPSVPIRAKRAAELRNELAGTSAAGAATALADLTAAAADDHDRVDELAEAAPHAVLVTVPLLTDDVHDVDGLRRIAELLTA